MNLTLGEEEIFINASHCRKCQHSLDCRIRARGYSYSTDQFRGATYAVEPQLLRLTHHSHHLSQLELT